MDIFKNDQKVEVRKFHYQCRDVEISSRFSACGGLKLSYLPYHQGAVLITNYNLQDHNGTKNRY